MENYVDYLCAFLVKFYFWYDVKITELWEFARCLGCALFLRPGRRPRRPAVCFCGPGPLRTQPPTAVTWQQRKIDSYITPIANKELVNHSVVKPGWIYVSLHPFPWLDSRNVWRNPDGLNKEVLVSTLPITTASWPTHRPGHRKFIVHHQRPSSGELGRTGSLPGLALRPWQVMTRIPLERLLSRLSHLDCLSDDGSTTEASCNKQTPLISNFLARYIRRHSGECR